MEKVCLFIEIFSKCFYIICVFRKRGAHFFVEKDTEMIFFRIIRLRFLRLRYNTNGVLTKKENKDGKDVNTDEEDEHVNAQTSF